MGYGKLLIEFSKCEFLIYYLAAHLTFFQYLMSQMFDETHSKTLFKQMWYAMIDTLFILLTCLLESVWI